MKRWCILRGAVLRAVLLLAAPTAYAIGLGPAEGVPLIGRPLNIAVPLSLDPGTDLSSSCASADVVQGETPTDGVQVRIEAVSPVKATLRVRTTRPVEEPVVTVTVHFGCFLKTTRRFVLLSDFPANASDVATQPRTRPQLAAVPGAFMPFGSPTGPGRAASQPATGSSRRAGQTAAEATTATARISAGAMSPRIARAPGTFIALQEQPAAKPRSTEREATHRPPASVVRVEPRNRLKLDSLDLAIDPEPKLKLTMSIDTVPQVTPQRRAEAAAVWKALNRSATDVTQDYERMQSMSADLTAMRQHITSNKTDLDAMRAKLEQSESDRDRVTWLLSGIVLALLLALAAALFLRRRALFASGDRSDPNWWRDSKSGSLEPGMATMKVEALPEDSEPIPSLDLDLDLSVFGDVEPVIPSTAGISATTGPISAFNHLDFQGSQPSSWRSLTTEELHDIEEQADFFVSLGDYDRAVNVLMSHVHASPHNSALAWMALLDLHHRLNRRQGYEGLRDQIERRMNVKVPEFEHYLDATAGLEAYADALARIVSLWPSRRVLDVIEESIYRLPGPGGVESEPFELAAFDELLLLYNIGKTVVVEPEAPDFEIDGGADGDTASSEEFPMTNVQPLSAELSGPSDEDMLALATLLAGSRLDVNLEDEVKAENATVPGGAMPLRDAFGAIEQKADNLINFENFDAATARLRRL